MIEMFFKPCLVCGALLNTADAESLLRHADWHVKHGDLNEDGSTPEQEGA